MRSELNPAKEAGARERCSSSGQTESLASALRNWAGLGDA
jgi:hypothetical protein